MALDRSVLAYDETAALLEQKLILLNIARRDAGYPVHFTITSSVAATFDWTTSYGVNRDISTGPLEVGGGLRSWGFNLGGSASENPTFSIIPVTGSDFTAQLLTPISEDIFSAIFFQGVQIDQALRLMGAEIEVHNPDGSMQRVIANDPRRPSEYKEFRRIASQLQSLHQDRKLFVRTLTFEETLIEDYPDVPTGEDVNIASSLGAKWRVQPSGDFELTVDSIGRVVILNYDPMALSDEQRFELNERIKNLPPSFVYLELRRGHPGGDLPIRGAFRLRSLIRILDFLSAGIGTYPEIDVPADPSFGNTGMNPANTLEIKVTESVPAGSIVSVFFNGKHYSVANTEWDRAVFRMLSWLFQAAVGDVESPGIPISIAK